MDTPTFGPGLVKIISSIGLEIVREAHYFDFQGISLCVSQSIDLNDWRVTEPSTGLAIPGVAADTIDQAHSAFCLEVPKIEAQLKKPLVDYLRNQIKDVAASRAAAARAAAKKN